MEHDQGPVEHCCCFGKKSRENDISRMLQKITNLMLSSLFPTLSVRPAATSKGLTSVARARHMRTVTKGRSALEGRHSQVFVGNLFAIEVVQKFGAIFVGIKDPHSTQMSVVEDGLPIRRGKNRRVHVQSKHGWWFESASQFVGVGARGCGGLVRARRDVVGARRWRRGNDNRKLALERKQKAFFNGGQGNEYSH